MAGIAERYGYGNALDQRLSGLNINQTDLPWWCSAILNWMGMASDMLSCPGEQGPAKRMTGQRFVEGAKNYQPYKIYQAYEDYRAYFDSYVAGRTK